MRSDDLNSKVRNVHFLKHRIAANADLVVTI